MEKKEKNQLKWWNLIIIVGLFIVILSVVYLWKNNNLNNFIAISIVGFIISASGIIILITEREAQMKQKQFEKIMEEIAKIETEDVRIKFLEKIL